MSMPKDQVYDDIAQAWGTYLDALASSLDLVERSIQEAKEVAAVCTDEWCMATEHVIDDLNNAVFSISEPRWISPEESKRLKNLKRRIYDLYVNYRGVYAQLK